MESLCLSIGGSEPLQTTLFSSTPHGVHRLVATWKTFAVASFKHLAIGGAGVEIFHIVGFSIQTTST